MESVERAERVERALAIVREGYAKLEAARARREKVEADLVKARQARCSAEILYLQGRRTTFMAEETRAKSAMVLAMGQAEREAYALREEHFLDTLARAARLPAANDGARP